MRMRSLLVAMAAVAIAFTVVIWFGFWIHARTNSIPDNVFGPIAYVAIFGIALLLTCWMLGISPLSGWSVKEMFGPRRSRGVQSSAAQAAYAANRNATATCAHLRGIEGAMRMAGVDVRLRPVSQYDPIIKAACRINEAELRRVFQLHSSVYYQEGYEPERNEFDGPHADIICGHCLKSDRARCHILVLHPDQCRADTPWFPAAP
jgi:hypothetical protein